MREISLIVMPKAKKASPLKARCLTALQLMVRLKGSDDQGVCECVTCGVRRHYKDRMSGGHFIPRGSRWGLEEWNVWPQCFYCNMWGMSSGSAAQTYTLHMIDHFGKSFVEDAIARKSEPVKRYKSDYEEMLKEFNAEIKFHKHRIGIL